MPKKEIIKEELKEILGAAVKERERLARYTTFKIGGPAEFLASPADEKSLRKLVIYSRLRNMPLTVLGGGSNILIKDKGVKGVVVLFDSPFFKDIKVEGASINAGSGASLAKLCKAACENSLSGLEPLAGIPGTVGGALIGNAGSRNDEDGWTSIGDFVESVLVCDPEGEYRLLKKNELGFDYRKSNLDGYIAVQATLKLKKGRKEEIKNRIAYYLKRKKAAQELKYPNAGCVFKNPQDHGKTSGQLIDECGLKGRRINGAQVSRKHANFIINLGKATSGDVLKLIDLIKKDVKKVHGVSLEEEIKII